MSYLQLGALVGFGLGVLTNILRVLMGHDVSVLGAVVMLVLITVLGLFGAWRVLQRYSLPNDTKREELGRAITEQKSERDRS